MYYNIKIKSKDSEFTLDSNNKAIIQREMDIYFAHIFNASEEFKSQIKKIEITNENVKSISEVEKIQHRPIIEEVSTNNIEEIKFSNAQENIQPELKQTSELKELEIKKEPQTLPVQEVVEAKQEIIQQPQKENLEDSLTHSITNIIKESVDELPQEEINQTADSTISFEQNLDNTVSFEIDSKEEVETLPPDVSIHPDELMKFQQSQENTQQAIKGFSQFEQTNTDESLGLIFQKIEEITQENNPKDDENEINEIINMAKSELNALDISQNKEFDKEIVNIVAPEVTEENTQAYLDNIYNQAQSNSPIGLDNNNHSQTNMQNVSYIDFETIDVTNAEIQNKYANMQVNKLKNEAFNIKTEDSKENIFNEQAQETKEQQNLNNIQEIDLNAFLKRLNNVKLITDEFLICAFYMKNFLNQEFFTMKQINSKLFQTTGKIASTSVAEELIIKGFLKAIDEIDSKKYCITTDGENHFAMTYQG